MAQQAGAPGWWTESKQQVIVTAVTGLPLLLINQVLNWVADGTTSQPWQVLWLLLPMGLIVYAVLRVVKRRGALRLHVPFLAFFGVYILIFSLAAGTRLLDWKQTLVGLEEAVPSNWLALNRLGDWRYWIAPRAAPSPDVILLTVEQDNGLSLPEGRQQIAKLIQLAVDQGARGIAFDFFLPQESAVDPLLCHVIEAAEIPVFIGYGFRRIDGDVVRRPTASTLESCLPLETAQGHLVGYLEADNRVRAIPTYFKGQADRPALSVRIAKALGRVPESPPDLIYFIAPSREPSQVSYADLRQDSLQRERLRDRLIIVGERSKRDTFVTPFGDLPGVFLHAHAAQSLQSGQFIQRQSDWSSFVLVFGACLLISVLAAQGVSAGRLTAVTAGVSIAVVAAAAAAMAIWRVWLAVVYPLAAAWLLLALLLGLRRSSLIRTAQ